MRDTQNGKNIENNIKRQADEASRMVGIIISIK